MKLYAQQGHATGNKVHAGIDYGYIDGVIFSPKDTPLKKLQEYLSDISRNDPRADLMVDPQYYASALVNVAGARLGCLIDGDYGYFGCRTRRELESEFVVIRDMQEVLKFQASLGVTHAIAPNILVNSKLDSMEGAIARSFIRNVRAVWDEVGDDRPVYATLTLGSNTLRDKVELVDFLNDITAIPDPPDGFYVLVRQDEASVTNAGDFRALAGWQFLNLSLSINGFDVVNGYSEILTPFLCAAGGTAGAFGWYGNLKSFALDRFQPSTSTGGRQPLPRYLSRLLLSPIRFDDLHRVRSFLPEVMNNLESDKFYPDATSKPSGMEEEMLQGWQTIKVMLEDLEGKGVVERIEQCHRWIDAAQGLYAYMDVLGIMPSGRQSDDHLKTYTEALDLFVELAELRE